MKNIRNVISIAALAAFVVGCATTITTPFDESAFQPYTGNGTSTITGQAFEKTVGGDVKYGAGDNVSLIPATPYTTDVFQAWQTSLRNVLLHQLPQTDPRLQKYVREIIADGSGNFEFQNIPAGEYYIVCPIFWGVAGQYGVEQTGAVAYAKTHVAGGETVKVVVTSQ